MRVKWKEWKAYRNFSGPRALPKGFATILQGYLCMAAAGFSRQTLIPNFPQDVLNVTQEELVPQPDVPLHLRQPDIPSPQVPKPPKKSRYDKMLEDTLPLGVGHPRRPPSTPEIERERDPDYVPSPEPTPERGFEDLTTLPPLRSKSPPPPGRRFNVRVRRG